MAEDKYLNYNVVVGINGNSYIQREIHLNDIYIPNKITCIDHPLKKGKFENGLIGNPLTQQYYIAKNWQYKQVGLFILDSKMFLRMSQQIEVWRMIDKLNGVSHYVLFHDEGYFNNMAILLNCSKAGGRYGYHYGYRYGYNYGYGNEYTTEE